MRGMGTDDEDYFVSLAEELGWPNWDAAMDFVAWRSGWRWLGVLVGLVLAFGPLGYVLGYAL